MNRGFVILDKPAGMTSFEACDAARKKLGAKKAGHAGTLDPNVTGILVIALNEAVKTMPLFNRLDKRYIGTAHLHKDIKEDKLKEAMKKFVGKIIQLPPRKSRVKRQERERTIYDFRIIGKDEKNFAFTVHCEAGTYIRKLIHDLGQEFGGAHMTQLRRIEQGPFKEKEAITLENLSEKDILTLEDVIKRLKVPIISVSEQEAEAIKQGKFLEKKGNGQVVIFSKNKVIALAIIEDNLLKPKRVI